jgi:hypothetical protein
MQENSEILNNQYVNNLNKQREIAEKELLSKNETIKNLELQLKNMNEKISDKSENYLKTVMDTQEQIKDLEKKVIDIQSRLNEN